MKITIKCSLQLAKLSKSFVPASVILAALFGTTVTTQAQKFNAIQTQKSPLVLRAQGSF